MTNAVASSFKKIFPATVVAPKIEILEGRNGKYMRLRGATITTQRGKVHTRTTMAYGQCYASVVDLLKEGTPILLAIQFDGPIARIIGPAHDKPAATNDAAPSDLEEVTSQIVATLASNGVHDDQSPSIAQAIINGSSERIPQDGDHGFKAATWAQFGHILGPIVDAGYDNALALTVASEILPTPAGDYLTNLITPPVDEQAA